MVGTHSVQFADGGLVVEIPTELLRFFVCSPSNVNQGKLYGVTIGEKKSHSQDDISLNGKSCPWRTFGGPKWNIDQSPSEFHESAGQREVLFSLVLKDSTVLRKFRMDRLDRGVLFSVIFLWSRNRRFWE